MQPTFRAAFAALSAAALAAQAQPSPAQPDPTDPAAVVPAIEYESVLNRPGAATSGKRTPDQAWRAANDAVAGQPGHAGHHPPVLPAPAPAEDPPRQAPAAPAKDGHRHHQHH